MRVYVALMSLVPMLLLAIGVAVADSATLNVANNGVDSDICGAASAPCRSISQAIANAADGDTVVVGPGRYGDLNGDGRLGGPGEEAVRRAAPA